MNMLTPEQYHDFQAYREKKSTQRRKESIEEFKKFSKELENRPSGSNSPVKGEPVNKRAAAGLPPTGRKP